VLVAVLCEKTWQEISGTHAISWANHGTRGLPLMENHPWFQIRSSWSSKHFVLDELDKIAKKTVILDLSALFSRMTREYP
jgi:hypothetical protein